MGERRNLALSYVLWALGLVGVCGVHRLYNRQPLRLTHWLPTFGLCLLGQSADPRLMPQPVSPAKRPLAISGPPVLV